MKLKFFAIAQQVSLNSDFYKCATGCVAVYKGHILAKGWNSNKTNPLQARYNYRRGFDGYKYPSKIHAEMHVISKIRYLDIDFSQVVVYISSSTGYGCRRPCEACEAALRELGIRRVCYTTDSGYAEECYC